LIGHITLDEGGLLRHRPTMAAVQVVQNHNPLPSIDQLADCVRTDITGTAGDQDWSLILGLSHALELGQGRSMCQFGHTRQNELGENKTPQAALQADPGGEIHVGLIICRF
jgi:hypothetical protein